MTDTPEERPPREPPPPPPPEPPEEEPKGRMTMEHKCQVVDAGLSLYEKDPVVVRARWGAMEPRKPLEERGGPAGRIFVVDTRTSQCNTLEECKTVIKEHQEAVIYEQGEDDLPYNFLVGGDGRVYEGRGWAAKLFLPPLMPDEFEDGTNFIIALIGDFSIRSQVPPPEKMVKARREFVMYGKDIDQFAKKIEVYTDIQWKV